ncbi:MAG TPA: cell division protein FtsW [Candidatus Egerieimonas intestinavium]|uniref:Probable peptidoglycan glycosyltransferase FtsW n=1 Tax=Candidatus Egerieimonas intestinavium TaxID=2840777 RepID=A0A9D1EJF8_9FIRM|nr:cell division protein FtsW [Candidatus Egerieimonas intestinavium]
MPKRIRKKAVRKKRRKSDYYDYNLLACIILLVCFGLVMLYSTSSYEAEMKFGDDMFYFGKQAAISAGAVLLAVIFSRIDYHWLMPLAGVAYVTSLILMILVKTPLGVEAYGARRWLQIPGLPQFQPSEIAKIAVIIFLPYVVVRMGKYAQTGRAAVTLLVLGGIQALVTLVFTDNLSTAIIIGGIAMGMVFMVYPKKKPFIIGGGVTGLLVIAGLTYLTYFVDSSENFRIRRILAWLRPEENLSEGGYQVLQSLYAIGSGGIFGKGLGNSAQKLGTIPEAQNDMIFSIICEELGIFGAVLVLLLFGYMLYRLFFIAQNACDLYGSMIAIGIMTHIALQVILNICVASNLIPTTGITLPFISYGGTSVLFLMMEMALALSVSRKIRFQQDEGEEEDQEN